MFVLCVCVCVCVCADSFKNVCVVCADSFNNVCAVCVCVCVCALYFKDRTKIHKVRMFFETGNSLSLSHLQDCNGLLV